MNDLIPTNPVPAPANSPALAYLASLTEGSRTTMRACLTRIAKKGGHTAESFPWHTLRFPTVLAIRTWLVEEPTTTGEVRSAATVNLHLSALRGVLHAAWKLNLMTTDDYHRAIDIEPAKATKLPRGRALEGGELRELFKACKRDETVAGRRDAAMIAILYGAGIRRAEAASLDLADYNVETGELKITGKGNKQRLCYATNGSADALAVWLVRRGSDAGPLFQPINKGGRIIARRMTDAAIRNMLVKRANEAEIKHVSPHDLRRSFVGDMLEAGADIHQVQLLAGHTNVQTTLRYDRRPEHAKKRAAQLLHVPFKA
jgi:site-specific recombinase XerD